MAEMGVALGTLDHYSREQSHDCSGKTQRPEATGLRSHSRFVAEIELGCPDSLRGYFYSLEEKRAFQMTQGEIDAL